MCLYPRIRTNPKYKGNKKNGGRIPKPPDIRVTLVPVKCGHCLECRNQNARDWAIRLKEEVRQNSEGTFVTLTFSNEEITKLYQDPEIKDKEGYELDNAAAKLAIKRFRELWRYHNGKSVTRWLITELGHNGTENIHLHGIIWSKDKEKIRKTWKYGWVYLGKYVSERTINYCMKYVKKIDPIHKGYKQIVLCSPGIGDGYTKTIRAKRNEYNPKGTQEDYQDRKGFKTALPIYYRNKIYSDEEREQLWIEKLDKGDRYILGQKINTTTETGKLQYDKMLKEAQAHNKSLGLGNGNHNWTVSDYEKERRRLLQAKRAQTNQIDEINKMKKDAHAEAQQTLGTKRTEDAGHPIDADRSIDVTLSRHHIGAGVLPASADRSTLGAPQWDETISATEEKKRQMQGFRNTQKK